MSAKKTILFTAATAFVGGFAAGIFFSSRSGEQFRRNVADTARSGSEKLSDALHGIEDRLETIEQKIETATGGIGQRVKDAAGRAVEHYVPGQESSTWEIDESDVETDLPGLPRD